MNVNKQQNSNKLCSTGGLTTDLYIYILHIYSYLLFTSYQIM